MEITVDEFEIFCLGVSVGEHLKYMDMSWDDLSEDEKLSIYMQSQEGD